MSLNWNVEAVKDHDSVCFIEAQADDPNHGVTKGDRMLNPVTSALIWATIGVDLPGITRENAAEFFARLRYTERSGGPLLIRAEVDGKRPSGSAAYVTPEEVVAHIGLTCNVTPLSRSAWLNKLKHQLDRDLDSSAVQVDELLEQTEWDAGGPSPDPEWEKERAANEDSHTV